jgi:predicted nucleotidyltransferase
MSGMPQPTPYRDLNEVLGEFRTGVRDVLGSGFTGAYLHGSFAVGDFDRHSDVDFLVVTREELTGGQIEGLRALHRRLFALESPWARHLEGSYLTRRALRRTEAPPSKRLYLDNNHSELVRSDHDNTAVVRWMLREHGIALAGPPARDLVDPVPDQVLRAEIFAVMSGWGERLRAEPGELGNQWQQPFAVLLYCRMLHALHTATIVSKPVAARWAAATLDPVWTGLIEKAWAGRPDPDDRFRLPADPADIAATLAFVAHVCELGAALMRPRCD